VEGGRREAEVIGKDKGWDEEEGKEIGDGLSKILLDPTVTLALQKCAHTNTNPSQKVSKVSFDP